MPFCISQEHMPLNQEKAGNKSGLHGCVIFLDLRIYLCRWKEIIGALKITAMIKLGQITLGSVKFSEITGLKSAKQRA